MTAAHAAVEGTWDLVIATPVGRLAVVLEIEREGEALLGTARSSRETVPLQDLTATTDTAGTRLTWRQSVTKPLRLDLDFDVVVSGDVMSGQSKAGRLPRSSVMGTRRPME